MAKPQKYDEKLQYSVKLSGVVYLFGDKLLPRHDTILSGRALNVLIDQGDADVIASADPR